MIPFMKSDPRYDILGQPFMFILDNYYANIAKELDLDIDLLHVIDHSIYRQNEPVEKSADNVTTLDGRLYSLEFEKINTHLYFLAFICLKKFFFSGFFRK